MTQVFRGGVLCLLLAVFVHSQVEEGTGGCVWDTDIDPKQGLNPVSFDAGARQLAYLPEITDRERCQKACCNNKDCQLALIGTPADDGTPECFLVSCMKDGEDVCTLKPETQFELYRKSADRTLRAPELHVVGLLSGGNEANSTDFCRQPVVAGKCRAAFPRFYYDITSGSCKLFLYGGCGANGNNFELQEECEKTCAGVTGSVLSKASEADGSSEPAPAKPSTGSDTGTEPGTPGPAADAELSADTKPGTPEPADDAKPGSPEPADDAKPGSPEPADDAEPGSPEPADDAEPGSPEPADDAEPGAGPGSLRSRKASPMPLSGEETRPLREEALSEFAEGCLPLPEAGPCRAALRHFYYDITTKTCQPFIYGGCRGNKNNYVTEEMCLSTCTVKAHPSSKKASDDDKTKDEDYEEACVVRSDPGPCRASFTMYHFNPDTGSCHPFTYGGCKGNGNRYGSAEECMARCTGEQGRFDEHGNRNRRRRWTPAFFLVATLAAISVLLLAALILVSTRRAQRPRAVSVSDKEELLPEEQSSMELPEEQSPQVARA